MKDRKYTESEIETFRRIGVVLLIGFLTVWAILFCFIKEAGIIATPFIFVLCNFYFFSGCYENIFLAHNKKIDKYEELKLQAQLQAEAERIRTQSQIWVSE
jgi:hypothetical protein